MDCLILWVNNLMFDNPGITEEEVETNGNEILSILRKLRGTVIFVTNEVGMGIIPSDATSRKYRDLVGRINQLIAKEANKVLLMACGHPIVVHRKKEIP